MDSQPTPRVFGLDPNLWHLHFRSPQDENAMGIEHFRSHPTYAATYAEYEARRRTNFNFSYVEYLAPGDMPRSLARPDAWFLHLDYYISLPVAPGTSSLQFLEPHSTADAARKSFSDHRDSLIPNGGRINYAAVVAPQGDPVTFVGRLR